MRFHRNFSLSLAGRDREGGRVPPRGGASLRLLVLCVILLAAASVVKSRRHPGVADQERWGRGGAPAQARIDEHSRVLLTDRYGRLQDESRRLFVHRDPFTGMRVAASDLPPSSDIAVTGIYWDSHRPMAIVNGMVVKIGDTVLGMEIVDIRGDRVIVDNGKEYLELKLSKRNGTGIRR